MPSTATPSIDVNSNRKMLRALLNRNGIKNVDVAENGLEAVEAALANPLKYDIIFMDNLMPVMVGKLHYFFLNCCSDLMEWLLICDGQNGVQAVRKLREGGFAQLVVGVTGNVLDDDVMHYLCAGADMVITKPVRVTLLKMLLLHVMQHGTLSRPGMELFEGPHGVSLIWREKKA